MGKFRDVFISASEIEAFFREDKEAHEAGDLLAWCYMQPESDKGKLMRAFILGMAYERVGVDNSAKPENY